MLHIILIIPMIGRRFTFTWHNQIEYIDSAHAIANLFPLQLYPLMHLTSLILLTGGLSRNAFSQASSPPTSIHWPLVSDRATGLGIESGHANLPLVFA